MPVALAFSCGPASTPDVMRQSSEHRSAGRGFGFVAFPLLLLVCRLLSAVLCDGRTSPTGPWTRSFLRSRDFIDCGQLTSLSACAPSLRTVTLYHHSKQSTPKLYRIALYHPSTTLLHTLTLYHHPISSPDAITAISIWEQSTPFLIESTVCHRSVSSICAITLSP